MNKKAFTLIEVLGTVVILGVLTLITVPVIENSIKNSREKAYDAQVKKIVEAAKEWSVKNNTLLPDIGSDEVYYIDLSTLIQSGYISDLNDHIIEDPRTGENMDGCVSVNYNSEYSQYIYEYREEC